MLADYSVQDNTSRRGRPFVGRPHQRQPQQLLLQKSWQLAAGTENKYRLPKLHAACQNQGNASAEKGRTDESNTPDAIYTRYGFYETVHSTSSSSLPELDSSDRRPYTTRSVFPGPAFTQAVVTPVLIPTGAAKVSFGAAVPYLGSSDARLEFKRSKTSCTTAVFSAFGSTLPRSPTVLGGWQSLQRLQQQHQQQQQQQQQTQPSLKADTGSSFDTGEKPVEWVMKPLRRFQIDKKGQQRNQGPFSRELQVHARAPQAWLRMKWGGASRPVS